MNRPIPDVSLPLPAGEVHLWVAGVSSEGEGDPAPAGDSETVDAADILSTDEVARLSRIRSGEGRRLFLAGRRLLRETLSRYEERSPGEWRFAVNGYGKPRIDPPLGDPPLAFNLSHTRGIAVLALVRGAEIGLDVERVDRPVQARRLIERFFSPREAAALTALSPEGLRERFFLHWTLKEACLKALGRGLSLPLADAEFALADPRPFRIAFAAGAGLPSRGPFHFFLVEPLPGAVAAVCLAGEAASPVRLRLFRREAGKARPLDLQPLGLSAAALR